MRRALDESDAACESDDRVSVSKPSRSRAEVTIALEPASSSILAEIADSVGGIPHVLLRDSDVETDPAPILKPSSSEMPELSERPDKYQLFGEIARGGMGAVLRGRDVDLGRELAVKVLLEAHKDKPELVKRFVEEAQIGGQLQHPGIVPVYELGGFADRRPFFTMKLVKGRTLAELLAARVGRGSPAPARVGRGSPDPARVGRGYPDPAGVGRESPDPARGATEGLQPAAFSDLPRFLSIFESIAQTMAYAHVRGVIHRDLKPSNIMVGSFGEVQVMDWGLAKVLPKDRKAAEERSETPEPAVPVSVIHTARSDSDADASTAGSVLGTPGYMAPEQARGETAAIDERADVFGLGAILCEILTGEPAFVGRSSAETLRKAGRGELGDAFARLDTCGAEAELIVLAKDCLAPEPEDRSRTAHQVSERITAYQRGVQERLRQTELARVEANARAEEERKRRKLTLGLAAALLALVTLGGGGAAMYFQERRSRAARLELAFREATLLRDQAAADPEGDPLKWQRAVESLKRADDLLGPLIATESERQVRGLRDQVVSSSQAAEHDAKLVRDVVDIRSAEADDPHGSASDAAYTAAFREAGLDVDALGPGAAAAKLKSRPPAVALALIAAVDDWAVHRRLAHPQDNEAWKRLVATARAADPDKTRDRLRQLWSEPDRKTQREPLLKLAKEADPHDWPPRSLTLLAGTLADAGEREAAVELLRRAQAEHPGDVWINYKLGLNLEQLHPPRMEEAIRYYSVARALRPETAHELAHALASRGRGEQAVVIFRDLSWQRPDNGRHWVCLASSLNDRGDRAGAQAALEKAVATLRAAIRLKPANTAAHVHLGLALDHQGKPTEAIAEYREAIRLDPGDAIAHNNLGLTMRYQGRQSEAIAAFREAIRLRPDLAIAHFNLGMVLAQQGNPALAITEFREAIRLNPEVMAHFQLGVVLSKLGKPAEAIAEYRETIRLKPDWAKAHNNLGMALRYEGKLTEAIAEYREAIRLEPDLGESHYNLGAVLCDVMLDYPAAIAEFREAIRLKPNDAAPHIGLGIALRHQGKLIEAIGEYREAIRLKPDDSAAHVGLGSALRDQGTRDEAIDAYREAIRLGPGDAEAHCNLGEVLARQAKFTESLAEYRTGHELGSKRPGWPYPSAQWVREAERRVELERRLPGVLRGDEKPKDAGIALGFADLARVTLRLGPSVRLYADAFRADPRLAEDVRAWNRYNAACSAALAGAGKSDDTPPLAEKRKTEYRMQALAWLEADLASWTKEVQTGKPGAKALLTQTLQYWKCDADLAGIRDESALKSLPDDQQKACRALWAKVGALLAKTDGS
jgi:serine/threonine-protein kinase